MILLALAASNFKGVVTSLKETNKGALLFVLGAQIINGSWVFIVTFHPYILLIITINIFKAV